MWRRVRTFWRWARQELELDEEIRFHLAEEMEERIAAGMSPEEARAAVRRDFGNVTLIRELTRETWGWGPAERLLQDVWSAFRGMRRNPGHACAMVAALALGIGTVTVAFSVIEPLLLRPVPYRDADSLYELVPGRGGRPRGRFVPPDQVALLGDQTSIFRAVDAYHQEVWATLRPEPQLVEGAWVTPGLFDNLGVTPRMGRSFATREATGQVALISDAVWRTRYGGDRGVLGMPLRLQHGTFTVVGVMPAEFRFPAARTEVWLPLDLSRAPSARVSTVARVNRGLAFEEANARLAALGQDLHVRGRPYQLVSLNWRGPGSLSEWVPWLRNRSVESFMLLVAVALVLLLTCANVASLTVAHTAFRREELALRGALGATWFRLFGQLVTESFVWAACGGVVGWVVARWALAGIGGLVPPALDAQTFSAVRPDLRTFLFALSISALTGLLAGVGPALLGARQSGRGAGSGATRDGIWAQRSRSSLLLGQVALATVLTAGAGQVLNSYFRLTNVSVGLDPRGLIAAEPVFRAGAHGDVRTRRGLVEDWADASDSDPRITAAAVATAMPLSFTIFSLDAPESGDGGLLAMENVIRVDWVSPDFFDTVGIPLVEGSTFDPRLAGGRPAVVSASLARQLWGESAAVGRRFRAGDGPLRDWWTVVGVAGDVSQRGVGLMANTHEVYLPLFDGTGNLETLYLLARGGDSGITAQALQEQLWRMAPDVPVRVRRVEDLVNETVSEPRFRASLLGALAGMALLLAMGGVYSVTSRVVATRRYDIGVRMALGAGPRAILSSVIGRECLSAFCGLGAGLFLAAQVSRLTQPWLPNVPLTDPTVNSVVAGCLAIAILFACAIPSWRAIEVDPATTLKTM